jgi:hypothetical protein
VGGIGVGVFVGVGGIGVGVFVGVGGIGVGVFVGVGGIGVGVSVGVGGIGVGVFVGVGGIGVGVFVGVGGIGVGVSVGALTWETARSPLKFGAETPAEAFSMALWPLFSSISGRSALVGRITLAKARITSKINATGTRICRNL